MKRRFRLALVAFAIYVGVVAAAMFGGSLEPRPHRGLSNGLWLGHRWWNGRPVSSAEVEALNAHCRAASVGQVFVHVGPLDARGALPPFPTERPAFEQLSPRPVCWAWVGGLNADFEGTAPDTVDLSKLDTRTAIARACADLRSRGFDGVQLDIEPIRECDPHFLELLDAIGGRISVASPHHRPFGLPGFLPPFGQMWTDDYYAEVGKRVEQIAYMGYDSAQPLQSLYSRWECREVTQIGACLPSRCALMVGVPTYKGDVSWAHHPSAETLGAALRGALASPARIAGLAIYAEWTTDAADWKTFEKLGTDLGAGQLP